MAQGKLYDVDMRLRPSGNQGPVATSLASFASYQKDEAWVWEHLALTRAQAIAGPQSLRGDVEALRQTVLTQPRARAKILGDVAEMRIRIAAAKVPEGMWDAKIGPGRLQDIELLAQAGALIGGQSARDIPAGIEAARAAGLFDAAQAKALDAAYAQIWALQCAGRLLSATPVQSESLGRAGVAFLCRTLGCDTLAALEARMEQTYLTAAGIIGQALTPPDKAEPQEAT